MKQQVQVLWKGQKQQVQGQDRVLKRQERL